MNSIKYNFAPFDFWFIDVEYRMVVKIRTGNLTIHHQHIISSQNLCTKQK